MSKNKQTADECLLDQIIMFQYERGNIPSCDVDKALQMEKEQHEQLYFEATKYACSFYDGPTKEDFDEDYKDIFENK